MSSSGHLQFSVANAGTTTQTPLDYAWSITASQWYNIAVTHPGMTWTLYIDGTSAQSNTSTATLADLSGNPVNIGSAAFAGNLDDVQLFHTAPTSTQVGDIWSGSYTPVSPYSTNENTATTISASTLLGNDTGPSGDPLTIVDYTQPVNGAVTYDGTNFTYTPNTNYYGPDQFTYTISDGSGDPSTATVYLTVNHVNQAPVAGNVSASTNQNTAVTINVLSQDSDPDGDTLTVTSVGSATDGTVSISGGATTVTYTPTSSSFVGQDSFTYTISDGHSHTATGTVYVTVTDGEWATSVIGESSEVHVHECCPLRLLFSAGPGYTEYVRLRRQKHCLVA